MDGFSINKIILGLQNPELYLKKLKESGKINSFAPELNSSMSNSRPQSPILSNLQSIAALTQTLQMNTLANIDRAVFIKNLLGLPPNLSDLLQSIQNSNKPINGGTLGVGNINEELLKNQKTISALFNEINPAVMQNQTQPPKDAVMLMFSGMISMPDISKAILQNSKHAVAELIISMASASKQGMNADQIRETLAVITSCISMAEADSPPQTLKSLMMLYLPWLPLNEGIGFDLEITPPDGENESSNSKLTVLIQTRNFGNIKGEFTLSTSNSVEILIICSESFPKSILEKSLKGESSTLAMTTNIDVEQIKPKNEDINEVNETKVNLSATNEMNPYLLLMAHSFIRNTILIDNNASLGL